LTDLKQNIEIFLNKHLACLKNGKKEHLGIRGTAARINDKQ